MVQLNRSGNRVATVMGCVALFGGILCGFAADLPKHWHESKGFATGIQAGIAGQVYKVTNLNSSGAGSPIPAAWLYIR